MIKYHEQSTFLIIDCSENFGKLFYHLSLYNANMGGGGGIFIYTFFSIIRKIYSIIIGQEDVGNGAKRSEIWE